jgi:ATP:ADP antiporter, AAA family
MQNFLLRALGARPRELPAVGWSFAYFFLVLSSYYVLRPLRDTFGVALGKEEVQRLFTLTFFVMLLIVPLFGWLCARFSRSTVLPVVYGFFALHLVWFSLQLDQRVFFVWLSVFNLFVVSVFWSFMADLFSTEQSSRLYGAIAAGGSLGALAGPLLVRELVSFLGNAGLLLLAAGLLSLAVPCVLMLSRWARAHPRSGDPPPDQPIGGSILAGARAALSSRYLFAICLYLFCYTVLSTALYLQQLEIVPRVIPERTEQTRLFAGIDLTVNALTLFVQLFAFARLTRWLGPAWMLALMPLVSLAGFAWLGAAPTLTALIVFGVTRRVGEFAISKPAREALFTVVSREERYKAKNFIDTVVYRGGDVLSVWAFGALTAAAAAAATGVALAWTAVAFYLGSRIRGWTPAGAPSSSPASRRS